jgi:hypothetical protein
MGNSGMNGENRLKKSEQATNPETIFGQVLQTESARIKTFETALKKS